MNTLIINKQEEKRVQERRRHLLYLIVAFLREQGYCNSAEHIFKEAQLSRDVHICDNIDLETIVLEYVDCYYAKYNRYPRLCKKTEVAGGNVAQNINNRKEKSSKVLNPRQEDGREEINNTTSKHKIAQKQSSWNDLNLGITVTPIFPADSGDRADGIVKQAPTYETIADAERPSRPIGDLYPLGSELREIADVISREIVQQNLNVHWDDVRGLKDCKTLLKEAIVYPIKYPSLFNGKLGFCKGVLLYGPPGTGKTMLAKAIATECQSTFFNITSSSVVSKWRGDTEKYIRVLIDLAKHHAPTIIFIDEIDWTTTKNADSSSSEPARRFRAELLARLDGLLSMEYTNVILLAATNVPWNIDIALLRRLEKRIFVDLPDEASRLEILRFYVCDGLHHSPEMLKLARETAGYSCADLKLLCKEAWINQLRPVLSSLETKEVSVNNVQNDDLIAAIDFILLAKQNVKPISKHMSAQYTEWHKEFGSSR